MASETMFGATRRRIPAGQRARIEAVAAEYGAYIVEYIDPGSGYQRWYAMPKTSTGEECARQMMAELRRLGIDQPDDPPQGRRYGWGGQS